MTEPSFLVVIIIIYLCVTVYSADINGDGLLSLQELSDWISEKIQEHINEALRENFGLFVSIDNNPRNGRLAFYDLCTIVYSEIQGIHISGCGRKLWSEGQTLCRAIVSSDSCQFPLSFGSFIILMYLPQPTSHIYCGVIAQNDAVLQSHSRDCV
jgi:hypothetical protein